MFRIRTAIAFLALIALVFASGCTSTSYAKIEGEKTNPKFAGGKGSKILLVMFTQDPALRQDIETEFAIASVDRNLDLTPSHRVIPNIKDVTKERLQDLVRADSYDRVVVIRTIAHSAKGGQSTRYGDYYTILPTSMYDYWGTTMATTFTPTDPPPTMGRYVSLGVEAVAFNGSDATMIWNSSYTVTTSEYRIDAARAFVKTVLGQLTSAWLI